MRNIPISSLRTIITFIQAVLRVFSCASAFFFEYSRPALVVLLGSGGDIILSVFDCVFMLASRNLFPCLAHLVCFLGMPAGVVG